MSNEKQDVITQQKIDHYQDITSRALAKVKLRTHVDINVEQAAKDYLDMAQRYVSDGKHFLSQGDVVNAFAAFSYAHGWLDAGARIGLFDVGADNVLFTVDEELVKQHEA